MADAPPACRFSRKELVVTFLSAAIGGGVTFVLILNGYLFQVLGIPAFLVFYVIAVCLHELGHACGALSVGGTVHFIQLGQRYREWSPWQFRFLGFLWKIYSAPFSGAAHCSLYTLKNYRLCFCWLIACGPLINLVLLSSGLLLLNFNQSSPYLTAWCVANVLLLCSSVPPMVFRYSNKKHPNDGFLFWQTLRYSDQEVENIVKFSQQTRGIEQESSSAQNLTLPELLAKHEAEPSNHVFIWHIMNQLQDANDPRCLEYLLKLIALPSIAAKHLTAIIDAHLTWQLHTGQPAQPDKIDQLSLRLLAADDSISTRGTRGSILIDLGRIDEGKIMLQEVLAKTTSIIDKTYANVFLALAAKAEGNLDLSLKYARTAREFDASSPALTRVSDLV